VRIGPIADADALGTKLESEMAACNEQAMAKQKSPRGDPPGLYRLEALLFCYQGLQFTPTRTVAAVVLVLKALLKLMISHSKQLKLFPDLLLLPKS
jgi:hypothetical protein